MPAPLVLVLYNQPLLPADHPDFDSENAIVQNAIDMATLLENDGGFRTSLLGLKQDPTLLWTELRRRKPAVVFNLFEGNLDNPETESYVAGLLQWKGVPFTGSPLLALTVARGKHLAKDLLRGAGLPTADCLVVHELPVPACQLEWPVIVKPALQDASVGLAQASVCTNQLQLDSRVRYILETYGAPVLVEEFIDGREFNVALTELPGLRYLPPGEVIFPRERDGFWPILTYDGKWTCDSEEYRITPQQCPADITPRLTERLGKIAMQAYRVMGCRDYGRVDFRVRPNGRPYILEVNPNPDISDGAGFGGCLRAEGLAYSDFLVGLIRHALNRPKSPTPTFAMPQLEPAT